MNNYLLEAEPHLDRRGFEPRVTLAQKYAWAIPTNAAIRAIVQYSPIVEVGAGTGYWAHLIAEAGGDVRAFDSQPPGRGKNSYGHRVQHFAVRRASSTVAARYPHRTLFLCWPPYDTGMSLNAIQAYKGKHVIFIGESRYGCTATPEFHDHLEERFTQIDVVDLPQWAGIHDSLSIWRRQEGVP